MDTPRRYRLNDAEKDILAGRVQRRVHHPNPVTADWAINWTRQAFGVTYTWSGIGKVLRSLGIKAQKDTREPVVSGNASPTHNDAQGREGARRPIRYRSNGSDDVHKQR